jgi:GT2 family glycosyltransferase
VSVDIVIVNWNGGPELLEAISSARRFAANVVVVDNASTIGVISGLAEEPGMRIIRNPVNVGFGAACNQGAAAADGEIIMLLNPDAQILEGDTADLERTFATSTATIVGFPLQQSSGDPTPSAYPMPSAVDLLADVLRIDSVRRRFGLPPRRRAASPARPGEPAWAIGAALALRRTDWHRLGGMDEGFFLWYEDVDLGARSARTGGTVAIAEGILIRHAGASTWVRFTRRRRQWLRVLGARRYAAKHHGTAAAALITLAAPAALAIGLALDVGHWLTRRP